MSGGHRAELLSSGVWFQLYIYISCPLRSDFKLKVFLKISFVHYLVLIITNIVFFYLKYFNNSSKIM